MKFPGFSFLIVDSNKLDSTNPGTRCLSNLAFSGRTPEIDLKEAELSADLKRSDDRAQLQAAADAGLGGARGRHGWWGRRVD
jgi:hypothetical protein